jgi:hypothetical protein
MSFLIPLSLSLWLLNEHIKHVITFLCHEDMRIILKIRENSIHVDDCQSTFDGASETHFKTRIGMLKFIEAGAQSNTCVREGSRTGQREKLGCDAAVMRPQLTLPEQRVEMAFNLAVRDMRACALLPPSRSHWICIGLERRQDLGRGGMGETSMGRVIPRFLLVCRRPLAAEGMGVSI